MKLIFVRHGEPLKDDYGIAKMGKEEMKLLAKYFDDNYSIDIIYSASSRRATESVMVLNELIHKDVNFCEWLNEFKYRIPIVSEKGEFPWELPPEYWINDDQMLDYKDVLNTKLLVNSEVVYKAEMVWKELDKIIEENGYERVGNLYKVNKPNKKEIVLVTHFATMAVMLAHLMNVSILVTLNMLFMAPSSYTVLATEEMHAGKAIFRCLELGSTKHLYGHNELKSEYGRQEEIKNLEI